MTGERPLVIAHRGSSAAVAEHTLAAYQRAIDDGADALECDVRLTRDGHLVCVHDRTLQRTSNGSGLVSEFELAQLNELDFGSWRNDLPADQDALVLGKEVPDTETRDAHSKVLTLSRLLELVLAADRPVRLVVETKHPTRYSGLVERKLVGVLRKYGLHLPADTAHSRVTVMSFSPLAVRRIRELAPNLPTVLLMHTVPKRLRSGVLPFGIHISGPKLLAVKADPDYVRRVHQTGSRVYVWVVDEPEDIEFVLGLGVDAVISNRPERVVAALGRTAGGRAGDHESPDKAHSAG